MASSEQRDTLTLSNTGRERQTTPAADQKTHTADASPQSGLGAATDQRDTPDSLNRNKEAQSAPSNDQDTKTGDTSSVQDGRKLSLALRSAPLVHKYINRAAIHLSFYGASVAFEYYRKTDRIPIGISKEEAARILGHLRAKYKASYAEAIALEFWKRWRKAIESGVGEDVYIALMALEDGAQIVHEGVTAFRPDHHSIRFGRKSEDCEEGSVLYRICETVIVDCHAGVDNDYITSIL